MADGLDAELGSLVLRNWGMVYDLQRRAEQIREELLQTTLESVDVPEIEERMRSDGSGDDTEVKAVLTKRHWYVGLHYLGDLLAYVQIEVNTDSPTLEMRVWTGFTGKGVRYAEAKSAIGAEVRSRQVGSLNPAGSNVITVERDLPLDGEDRAALATEVAEEVGRQLDVAVELYRYVRTQRKAAESGDG